MASMPVRTARRYAAFTDILWRSSRRWTGLAVGCAVLAGLLPAVTIIASGVLVGSAGGVASGGLSSTAGHRAVTALVVFGAVSVLYALVGAAQGYATSALTAHYVVAMDDRLAAVSLGPDRIAHLEDVPTARQLAAAVEAGREGVNLGGPGDALVVLQMRLSAFVAALILFAYQWWAPLLMAAGWLIFGWTLGRWVNTLYDELIQVTGSDRRRAEYLRGVLHGQGTAKEIRIFGLADWLVGRYADVWMSAMRLVWRNRQRTSGLIGAGIVAMVLANGLVISLLGHDAFTGHLSTGRLVVFVQAMFATVSLGLIGDPQWNAGRAAGTAEHVRDLGRRFGRNDRPAAGTPAAEHAGAGVELRGVRFTYPSRERPTLDGLDLSVPPGQSLAIVGVNGAGKSTLIKLLAGLYAADSGSITIDGIDAATGNLTELRARVAVVFQDFLRYELPLRDNIGFGNLALRGDADRLAVPLDEAGGTAVLDRLDGDWDTVLSAAYDGGTDLSGGQWQRVALARALTAVHGGAGLLILDEPTAALDVRAEVELFERLLSVVGGVTTILVSHRLSSVRHADRIVVVADGRIAEDGTHDELLAAGGLYARMFTLQAQRFAETGDVDA